MKDTKEIYSLLQDKLDLLTTDSRSVTAGSIFLTLKGDKFDGNSYVEEALKKGASFVIADNTRIDDPKIMKVSNAYKTLVNLARTHRQNLNTKIIALTGTNGKTTTKELLYHIFKIKYNTLSTLGNLNNHIGVPLTLLKLKSEHEFLILEMGANKKGDILELCEISSPDYGLITNIGKAHLEGFGSLLGVLNTKTELFDFINTRNGTIFLNTDSEMLMAKVEFYKNIVSYGSILKESNFYFKLNREFPSIEMLVKNQNKEILISSGLFGSHNFENLMAAITVAQTFDIEYSEIQKGINSYIPKNMRSQLMDWNTNVVILDAYNANPSSMKKSIESLNQFEGNKKWLILGEMAELGAYSEEEHLQVFNLINQYAFEKRILVGEAFKPFKNKKNIQWFLNSEECKIWIQQNLPQHTTILIKGSRSVKLENIIQ